MGVAGGGGYGIKRLIQPHVTLACCLYNLRPYYCTLISSTVFHSDTLIYLIIISSWQWFWFGALNTKLIFIIIS